jgi:hypothetical protein
VRLTRRLRAWLRGERRASSPAASASTKPSKATEELDAFASSRRGVEAYLEPRTNLYGLSMVLVADDGEYLRRPITDRAQADSFCRRHGVPLYEAARVGYPRRMREFQQGRRRPPVELSELPPWPSDGPGPTDAPPTGHDAGPGGRTDPDPRPPGDGDEPDTRS